MNQPLGKNIYELIGEDQIAELVAAFYAQVPDDEVLRSIYPQQDLAGAERRLRDFLVYRLGGPHRYIEQRGHPRLRMRHAQFRIDQRARDHWMRLMDNALAECQLPNQVASALRSYLDQTGTFMINSGV